MFQLPSLYRHKWRWPIGTLLLLYIIAMYGIPGHWPLFAPIAVPLTVVDRIVPFDPRWVWIYASYYFMLIGAFFSVRNDRDADLYIWDLVVTAILGTLCFYLYPTEISRAPYGLVEPFGISEKILWLIRLVDRDVNCAPSMHVAMSTVAAASFGRLSKRARYAALAWTLAIVYSTLATKQHYFIDAITGAAIGIVALELVRRCRLSSNGVCFASVTKAA